MNLPNILTMIRFALIPIMVYLLALEQYWQGIAIYTLASITDILDGYIARKYNLITPLGKILDPTADKLLQFSALIMLNIILLTETGTFYFLWNCINGTFFFP